MDGLCAIMLCIGCADLCAQGLVILIICIGVFLHTTHNTCPIIQSVMQSKKKGLE